MTIKGIHQRNRLREAKKTSRRDRAFAKTLRLWGPTNKVQVYLKVYALMSHFDAKANGKIALKQEVKLGPKGERFFDNSELPAVDRIILRDPKAGLFGDRKHSSPNRRHV